MKRARFLIAFSSAALCAVILWAQGIIVCPSCGREAKPGETVCSHCQAKLPLPKVEKEAPPPPPAKTESKDETVAKIAAVCVKENVRMMRELAEKQPAVAYYYAQNALAVQRLTSQDKKVGDEILAGNKQLLARVQQGWVACRFCNGTGTVKMIVNKRDGKVMEGPKMPCKRCNGKGGHVGQVPPDRAKMALVMGRREFERQRMLAGEVKLGRAFVPSALETALDTRQRALVMTGFSVPCPDCLLTGRQLCTTCKGTGYIKCTNQGCVNGELQERNKQGRKETRLNDSYRHECPVCNGTGEVPCKACGGLGGVPCRKCSGSGIATPCRKCSGVGFIDCTHCKGSGEVRGQPCPECKGEKVVLCPTCRGEGADDR